LVVALVPAALAIVSASRPLSDFTSWLAAGLAGRDQPPTASRDTARPANASRFNGALMTDLLRATQFRVSLIHDRQLERRRGDLRSFPGRHGQRHLRLALAGLARDSHGAPKTHVSLSVPDRRPHNERFGTRFLAGEFDLDHRAPHSLESFIIGGERL